MFFDFIKKNNNLQINSPVSGKIKNLENVKDEAFSKGLLGNGIAIIPQESNIYSPVDGVLTSVFPTGHAFGITTKEGIELILHIGVDTVKLKGQGFDTKVEQDKKVKKGELLTICDFNLIKNKGYETDVIMVISNHQDYKFNCKVHENEDVNIENTLIEMEK